MMIRFARLISTTCVIWSITHTMAFGQAIQTAQNSASSQDIGGVWVGQMSENLPDGRVGHGSLYLRLKQSGADVSGVAGDSEATASPIENNENYLVAGDRPLLPTEEPWGGGWLIGCP